MSGGTTGVHLSDNGGTTWRQTAAPVPFSAMVDLARDGQTYVSAGAVSYRSTDGGATWETLGGSPFGGLDRVVRFGSTFYAKNGIGFRASAFSPRCHPERREGSRRRRLTLSDPAANSGEAALRSFTFVQDDK